MAIGSVSFGTNVNACRKQVKFVNSNASAAVTIYEGMPLCYEYSTTTNVLGWDKENSTEGTTTADGYQNEGKFLLVDLPEDDNLLYFAGVVAAGGWCGKEIADDGEQWLDIFIPNGAIVPVRCDVETTTGQTILSIRSDSQELESVSGGSGWNRAVGIAMETDTGLDSAAGLTLCKLDPNLFIFQDASDGDGLEVSGGQGGMALNRINVVSDHTSGSFCALEVITESGVAESSYGLAFMAKAVVTGAVTAITCGTGIRLAINGGTQTEQLSALRVQLVENTGADVSTGGKYTVLNLVNMFAENPLANSHQWIYLENDGSYPPDNFIYAKQASDIPMVSCTDDPEYGIPIIVGGTQYWIAVCAATS